MSVNGIDRENDIFLIPDEDGRESYLESILMVNENADCGEHGDLLHLLLVLSVLRRVGLEE